LAIRLGAAHMNWLQERFTEAANWAFGDRHTEAGEAVDAALEHSWTLPPWLTLLLVGALVALVAAVYVRERSRGRPGACIAAALLRMLSLAVVLVMLAGFVLQQFRTELPDLVILIDDSGSMGRADYYDDEQLRAFLAEHMRSDKETATRLHIAQRLLLADDARLIEELRQRYTLRFYRIGESARRVSTATDAEAVAAALQSIRAEGTASRLGRSLRQALEAQRGRPTAAVIVLTDGATTDGPDLAEAAKYAVARSIPIYPVGIGSPLPPRDLELASLRASDRVYINDNIRFDYRIHGEGFAGRTIDIVIRDAATGEIQRRSIDRIDRRTNKAEGVILLPADREGVRTFLVEVRPLAEETRTDNNSLRRSVRVHSEKIRVLLVQEKPSFEFRYLQNVLERKQRGRTGEEENPVELTTILREADPQYTELRRPFPIDFDQLNKYHVLILADISPTFFSKEDMQNIVRFVKEEGGGVMFVAGPWFMPLAYRGTLLEELLPVRLENASLPPEETLTRGPFVVRPTRVGLSSPQMQLAESPAANIDLWRSLPPLYWLLEAPQLKSGARRLAEHPTRSGPDGSLLPVISMQYVGSGKVIFHATDETWRWRKVLRDKLLARYWGQSIYHLSQGKLGRDDEAELATDRREYRRGQPVKLTLRWGDQRRTTATSDTATVVLRRRGRPYRFIELRRRAVRGVYEATVDDLEPGDYQAWVVDAGRTTTRKDKVPADEAFDPREAGSTIVSFDVRAADREFDRTQPNRPAPMRTAQLTQGSYVPLTQFFDLPEQLPEGRSVRTNPKPPVPIWNSWPLWLLLVVLLTTEWILRKRLGLL